MKKLSLILLLSFFTAFTAIGAELTVITGRISDMNAEPLIGASLVAKSAERKMGGVISSLDGKYNLKLTGVSGDSITVMASSIGYETRIISLSAVDDTININFSLAEKPVECGTIVVTPAAPKGELLTTMSSEQIDQAARHSLITTNPISAIRQPQVIREGSNHSSKLRINGTSPTYYLNGVEMGYDPNHYGMFSIVPGSVVDNIRFFPQGTSAASGSPSIIEFGTLQPFESKPRSEMDLSFIEGTGSLSMGNQRFYLLSTVRKSVLDKLADKITKNSQEMTIPPTDFRDIFISAGARASTNLRFLLDHYNVTDYLLYNLGATANNPGGINTAQHTTERYLGIRLEALYTRLSFKISVATKESREKYHASSVENNGPTTFLVDLSEKSRTNLAASEISLLLGQTRISAGSSLKYVEGREIELRQTNWNFLPPDASSDNPFVYQDELNRFYGSYKSNGNHFSDAGYFTVKQPLGPVELESGLRTEYYKDLGKKSANLLRNSVKLKSNIGTWGASFGTYAHSPLGRILEPFQVLIEENIAKLRPVETNLAAISWSAGPVRLGAFKKSIFYLPRITPDYSRVDASGVSEKGFLTICPDGQINSYGADITFELRGIQKLDLSAYYGFSHADKVTKDITVPYELNAPHRVFTQAGYKITNHFRLGASFSLHTGFPYTGASNASNIQSVERYTDTYYRHALESENSSRFPINISTDLYGDLNFGRCQIYATLSNISNHKNPIICTADGFVYDTGILPSLGLRYKF